MSKRGRPGFPRPVLTGVLLVLFLLFVAGFVIGPLGRSVLGDLGLPSWLSFPRPEPKLPAKEIFHLFGFPITNSMIGAWLTMIVLVGFSYAVTRRLKLIPTRWQSVLEFVLGSLLSFCQSVAGDKNGRRFFPVVATIFLFVVMNAWLSLLPVVGSILITNAEGETASLLRGANTDINMPLALALTSFVAVGYFGMRSMGVRGYLGQYVNVRRFFGGFGQLFRGRLRAGMSGMFTGVIDIFIGALEALSHSVRIISFTFRLFGNMLAAKILILSATFLIPWVFVLPFYGLELLIGFIQGFIFGGLTLVFLTIAVSPHGAEAT